MALIHHINKLQYFCGIIEAKSILKASSIIGVTQPQLSRVVKQLEEELETQLMVRTSTGVEPTKEGQDLYTTAKKVIEDIQAAEHLIKYGHIDLKGELRVSTYDSIAIYFFPSFLKYLKASIPQLKVYVTTMRSNEVYQDIQKAKADIGICVDQDIFNHRGIQKTVIYNDSFGFYQHPNLSPEFQDQVILFPEASGIESRSAINDFLKSYQFQIPIVSHNIESVKSLAETGIGVGFLPHRVARESILQGKLVPLKSQKSDSNLGPHSIVLCRRKSLNSDMVMALEAELMRFLSSWSKSRSHN